MKKRTLGRAALVKLDAEADPDYRRVVHISQYSGYPIGKTRIPRKDK